MPNIQSAKKRVSVNSKKKEQNRPQNSALKTAVKKFNAALDLNDVAEADRLLPETYAVIDSCCQKGVIHKNSAANKKSALAKRLSDIKLGKAEVVIKKDNRTIAAEKAKAAQEARDAAVAESKRQASERKAEKEAAEKAKAEAEKKAPKRVKKEKAAEDKPKKEAKKAVKEEKTPAAGDKKTKKDAAAEKPAKEKPAKAPKKAKEES